MITVSGVLHSPVPTGLFPQPYRGWAYVGYDGNDDRASQPIDETRLASATDFDPADPYAEPNQLLKGLNLGEFEEMPNAGLASPLVATSRGCAFGDLDNDGSIDIVVINHDGPAHVLRNVTRSTEGHWVMFRAQARTGIDARNSVLRIQTGSAVQWRQETPNEGYCSSNDPRVHFGIGSATRIDSLTIYWKKGDEEVFGPFAADATYTVLRGTGRKPD